MTFEKLKGKMVGFWRDEKGQGLAEYALMAGFVVVAAGAIMPGVGTAMQTVFMRVGEVLNGVDQATVLTMVPAADSVARTRIVCAVLAVLFLGIIFLRRKNID